MKIEIEPRNESGKARECVKVKRGKRIQNEILMKWKMYKCKTDSLLKREPCTERNLC